MTIIGEPIIGGDFIGDIIGGSHPRTKVYDFNGTTMYATMGTGWEPLGLPYSIEFKAITDDVDAAAYAVAKDTATGVGVLFGGVAAGIPEATIGGAVALALGIGIQNFPEGLAVSMPLRRQGVSRVKSFWYGQLSAIVEPIAAVVGAVAVTFFTPILPYALAFAAGAMIFVVVEEVIPETQRDKYTDIATLGFIGGFIVMMTLDVALG